MHSECASMRRSNKATKCVSVFSTDVLIIHMSSFHNPSQPRGSDPRLYKYKHVCFALQHTSLLCVLHCVWFLLWEGAFQQQLWKLFIFKENRERATTARSHRCTDYIRCLRFLRKGQSCRFPCKSSFPWFSCSSARGTKITPQHLCVFV